MKQLFPPEIIEYSAESHFSKRNKSTSIIYIAVMLFIAAIIAILPVVKVEITTQSRGIVKSAIENNQLQAVIYGEIEDVFLYENKNVEIGDTLMIISTKKLKEQKESYKRNLLENNAYQRDIKSILSYRPELIRTPKYNSEYNEYCTQLKEQQLQTELLLHEKKVSDQLYEKRVEPEMDHIQIVNRYNLSVKREKLIHDQFHKRWQAELSQLEIENRNLVSNIEQLSSEQKQYIITAPISGTIIQYAGLTKGNFIGPNQVIAQISPTTNLLVECYVSPSDIGYLSIGTSARFQFDAYNYNQWGLASGEIQEVSSDLIAINDQLAFKVRCSLNNTHLQLKNNYKGQLKKGMTLTCRFNLTERSLSQLLFDKVDNWLNPKLVNTDVY